MPNPDLLPCPFCGVKPHIRADGGAWLVQCINKNCVPQVRASEWTVEATVAAWNRRDPSPEYVPQSVWAVENKTTRVFFATKDDAQKYRSQFGAAVGGGMLISEVPVIRFDISPREVRTAVSKSEYKRVTALGGKIRPPKPKSCENGCPPQQVCDHCQWSPDSPSDIPLPVRPQQK